MVNPTSKPAVTIPQESLSTHEGDGAPPASVVRQNRKTHLLGGITKKDQDDKQAGNAP